MRITAVLNQKGGVGKTGLAVGAAAALADAGRRVLLIDLDQQGHATVEALGLEETERDARLARALVGEYIGPAAAIADQHSPGLDVWANSVDMFLVARRLDQLPGREFRLTRLLEQVADRYDHAVIDCPPNLDACTDNALAAADGIVIPVQAERTSLRALDLLFNAVRALEDALRRPPITVHGLVPGLYQRPLTVMARTVMSELEGTGLPIVAHVPKAVAVTEAWWTGTPMTRYAPHSEQATAYRKVGSVLDGTELPAPARPVSA